MKEEERCLSYIVIDDDAEAGCSYYCGSFDGHPGLHFSIGTINAGEKRQEFLLSWHDAS